MSLCRPRHRADINPDTALFYLLSYGSMSVERNIRFDLIARLCPNASGAELRSVCTEAGMFAIRARRKVTSEADFLASKFGVVDGPKRVDRRRY